MATVSYAGHHVSDNTVGEACRCGNSATHKIGEELLFEGVHNLIAYVCCSCFESVIGHVEGFPYDKLDRYGLLL